MHGSERVKLRNTNNRQNLCSASAPSTGSVLCTYYSLHLCFDVDLTLPHPSPSNRLFCQDVYIISHNRMSTGLTADDGPKPHRPASDPTPDPTTGIKVFVLPIVRVQELCESRGGRPELSVLTSLTVSVDVKQHRTVLRHWSQFVPNMSTDIRGQEALHHHQVPTFAALS